MTTGEFVAPTLNRRTGLKLALAGAVVTVTGGGGALATYLLRAAEASAAQIETGWRISDEIIKSLGLATALSATEWLASHGIKELKAAVQSKHAVHYEPTAANTGAKSPGTSPVIFPVQPIGEPKLSKLVAVGLPQGGVIMFLPRGAQALSAAVGALAKGTTKTRPMSIAEASAWLMPQTLAVDKVPGDPTFIEYASEKADVVQIMHRNLGAGKAREQVSLLELGLSWSFPVAKDDLQLASTRPL